MPRKLCNCRTVKQDTPRGMGIVLSPPSPAPFCATSLSEWWLSWQLGKLGWACSCWAVSISPNLLCLWCTFLSGFLAQFRCRSSFIRLGPASWWPPAMGGIVFWSSLSLRSLLLAISLGWGGNDDICDALFFPSITFLHSEAIQEPKSFTMSRNAGKGERKDCSLISRSTALLIKETVSRQPTSPCLRQALTAGT